MYVNTHILKIGQTVDLVILNISGFTHIFVNTDFKNKVTVAGSYNCVC